MKWIPVILGLLALALTIVPAVLFTSNLLLEPVMKGLMLAGTCLWFVAAPWWLRGGGA